MTKSRLRSAALALAGAFIGAGAALAQETEPTLSHPADPILFPGETGPKNAFDLAVPMLDRPDAHPSYGPAPVEGAGDPVAEMDHSAHQMPGMDMNNMPGMTHDMPQTSE